MRLISFNQKRPRGGGFDLFPKSCHKFYHELREGRVQEFIVIEDEECSS